MRRKFSLSFKTHISLSDCTYRTQILSYITEPIKPLGEKAVQELCLFDQLTSARHAPLKRQIDESARKPNKPSTTKPRSVSLIDRLKDFKMQNMWEPCCQLFTKAHRSNTLALRWQRFHVKSLLECLGNCYRWNEIEETWRILKTVKQSAHTLLDDSLLNVLLNITAIKKAGSDFLIGSNHDQADQQKETLIKKLEATKNIDDIFHAASEVVFAQCQSKDKTEKPFFLKVYEEMLMRGFKLDHYGSRGFIIGTARGGMWRMAAQLARSCDRKSFSPPTITNFDASGEDDTKFKAYYEMSEIEISEIARKSSNPSFIDHIIVTRFANDVKRHAIPNKILLAAMTVQPDWEKALAIGAESYATQIDAGLINLAVSVAFKGCTSAVVVQRVFDHYVSRVLNPSQHGADTNALPMIAIARSLTKAYEMTIQCHAREGNWQEALRQLYISQKHKVPCSIDLHGSVLRALNKANRPVEIMNSFLALRGKDENPTGKKSLLKTLSLINAYTAYKRKRFS